MEQNETLRYEKEQRPLKEADGIDIADAKKKWAESRALNLALRSLAIKFPYVDDKFG